MIFAICGRTPKSCPICLRSHGGPSTKLKGSQGTLREDVELFAAEQKANGFKDTKISQSQTVDGDHGRIETRIYTVFHDVACCRNATIGRN